MVVVGWIWQAEGGVSGSRDSIAKALGDREAYSMLGDGSGKGLS